MSRRAKQIREQKQGPKSRNLTTPVLLVILVGVICFGVYKFLTRQGVVNGTVVHAETNEDIRDVRVVLDSHQAVVSNPTTGLFSFSSIDAGPHTLLFQKPGFNSLSQTFTLKPGETKRMRISLRPKDISKASLAGTFFAVTAVKGKKIEVFDAQTQELYATLIPDGEPKDMAFFNGQILSADYSTNTVSVFNLEKKRKVKSLSLPENSETSLLTPAGNKILGFNFLSKTLFQITPRTMTLEPLETVLPGNPQALQVADGQIFILHAQGMTVISPNGEIQRNVNIPNLVGDTMAYNTQTNQMMIPNGKELLFVDINSETVEHLPLQVNASEVAYSQKRQEIYIGDKSRVSILDAFTREYKHKEINTEGEHLSDLSVSPDEELLALTHRGSNNVMLMDLDEQKIVNTLSVGAYPVSTRFFKVN